MRARLTFRVDGKLSSVPRVSCNGHRLVAKAATATEIVCDVPADQLRRLNEIVISAVPRVIRGVTLDCAGLRFRDLRFAPAARPPLKAALVSSAGLSIAGGLG